MTIRRLAFRASTAIAACALVAGAMHTAPADAHGGRGPRVGIRLHVGPPAPVFHHAYPRYRYWGPGVIVGPGVYYGTYGAPAWGPNYYYEGFPPAAEQPTYIERGMAEVPQAAQPAIPGDWYWCSEPEGYYPHLKDCPVGWRKVPAQPPGNINQ